MMHDREEDYPNILVSDENDENPRPVRYREALENDWYRRVVKVLLVHTDGKVFFQKRSQWVSIYKGYLEASAAGNVDEGSTYEQTAHKELEEELGISNIPLVRIGKAHTRESDTPPYRNCWQEFYVGTTDSYEMNVDPREVDEGTWFTFAEADQLFSQDREAAKYVNSLKIAWEFFKKNFDFQNNRLYPNVIVSDENDENPRPVRFHEAVESGLFRRVSQIMLYNSRTKKLLMQRRSENVHGGNTWANSASGVVDAGESYEDAAYREMREEIGVTTVRLEEVSKNRLEYKMGDDIFKAWMTFYIGEFDGECTPDPYEVSEMKWFSIDEIETMLAENPRQFVGSFPYKWPPLRDIVAERLGT